MEKLPQWLDAFEKARGGDGLTKAEIEAEAQRVFTEQLAHLHSVYTQAPRPVNVEEEELSLLASHLADAGRALPGEADPAVSREIAKITSRTGANLEPGSTSYMRLVAAVIRAMLHAVLGRQAALNGNAYEPPPTFGGLPEIDPLTLRPIKLARIQRKGDGQGVRFSEAAERYLTELQRDPASRKTGQTVAQHEAVFRLFKQFVGDAALDDISDEKAAEFLGEVSKLHPHWGRTPETKRLSVWEILERYGHGDQHLSNRTMNRYVSSLGAVFKWAKKRAGFKGHNPFADQSYEKASGKETAYKLYNENELQLLLDGPERLRVTVLERTHPTHHDMASALRWLPLLALFTGARQGELCQLHTADVQLAQGIHYFRIHAEREGQRLKTEAAERLVPVHSTLIHCGFLEYVAYVGGGQLFPGLKPGGPDGKLNAYFTKRFTAYRRAVGISRAKVVFHSLRKNAAQALKNARATPNDIAELIGHERGFTVETYAPLGLPLPVLKELVERITFPSLDLSKLKLDTVATIGADDAAA